MFKDNKLKQAYVRAAKIDAGRSVESGKFTPLQGDNLIRGWEEGLTIASFLREIRSSGILAVFTNVLGNAIEQQAESIASWHTYAIYYENSVLAVYDPSYILGTDRHKACTGVALLKELVKAFKARATTRTLSEIWFGGGGNDGVSCQEMTRDWVENEIIFKRGRDLGNWDQLDGWTRVHF